MSTIPIALTIAGTDPTGGAGIQADIKSFSANQVYAASVITALPAQNTTGVIAIHDIPPDFVTTQLDAVFSDLNVAAVKIGMLASREVIASVAAALRKWQAKNIVIDPVMVAASGDPLIADDAVMALRGELLPLATLVTPNLHEAARLTHSLPAKTRAEMATQGRGILAGGAAAVLVKGGHPLAGEPGGGADDLLLTESGETWFEAARIDTENTHGTGCSLSSAIAAHLARGAQLEAAVGAAKDWLSGAIAASDRLAVGKGHGPVHHFHNLWPDG